MYDDNQYYDNEYPYPARNPMATASITLGIISIVSCTFFYVALPCGALAILCAILSRSRTPMPKKSRMGIIAGLIGIAATAVITVTSLHSVLTNPELRAYVEQYLQYYTGDPSITLDDLFPFIPASDGGAGAEEETESESDTRVRLRIASDEPETSQAAEDASDGENASGGQNSSDRQNASSGQDTSDGQNASGGQNSSDRQNASGGQDSSDGENASGGKDSSDGQISEDDSSSPEGADPFDIPLYDLPEEGGMFL